MKTQRKCHRCGAPDGADIARYLPDPLQWVPRTREQTSDGVFTRTLTVAIRESGLCSHCDDAAADQRQPDMFAGEVKS